MGFSVLNNIRLKDTIIKKGSKIITAISYRYTKVSPTNSISKYFNHFTYYESDTRTSLSILAFKLYHKSSCQQ